MNIFQKVHCKAYLKKVRDGVYIQLFNPDGTFCHEDTITDFESKAIAYKGDEVLKDLSDFSGDCVEKTYRERVETEFDGILVGITHVDVKGLIGTDCGSNAIGREYGYCSKEIKERPKVGVVYFKNNAKRYVLLSDITEVIEGIST